MMLSDTTVHMPIGMDAKQQAPDASSRFLALKALAYQGERSLGNSSDEYSARYFGEKTVLSPFLSTKF